MVAFTWICDAAARQEGPTDEGSPAAVPLQGAQVHMVRHCLEGVVAVNFPEAADFLRGRDGKALFPGTALVHFVKFHLEGTAEEPGQPVHEGAVAGDEAHLARREGVAV